MENIIEARDVTIEFHTRTATVPAVRGVSFRLRRGEIFGLVGESGCGKSTMAYATMGYVAANGRFTGGQILYKGRDLIRTRRDALRGIWGHGIGMVYQDPSSHLNPSMRIGDQLAEMYGAFDRKARGRVWDRVVALLESVRISDPGRVARNYHHQLSGGMLQRVCIAMAMARTTDLLIMDEPTTALDVTTEAVILDLVNALKKEHDLANLYITHDLGWWPGSATGWGHVPGPAGGGGGGGRPVPRPPPSLHPLPAQLRAQPGRDQGLGPAGAHSRGGGPAGGRSRGLRLRRALPQPLRGLRRGGYRLAGAGAGAFRRL